MERTGAHARAVWGSDGNIQRRRPPVAGFGYIIDYLIKAARDEICKLHLHHGLITFPSQAYSAAQHARFHKGCIADTLFTKLFYKSFSNITYAAIFCNILATYVKP